jgi:methylated-DNA-[protein]-cysteine S-methyltransferase
MTSTDPDDDALTPTDPAVLMRLHARFDAEAEAGGVLDVAYRSLPSPVGDLLLAATPAGLVRVSFIRASGSDAVLAELARDVSPRLLNAPARLDDAARELDEYFAGRRHDFDISLDLRLARGFRRRVLERLRLVGWGRTVSYGGLAAAVGSPRAVRATGSACAANPLPVVVPCHRVLRADGSLGGYAGGLDVKRRLLALEGSRLAGSGPPA